MEGFEQPDGSFRSPVWLSINQRGLVMSRPDFSWQVFFVWWGVLPFTGPSPLLLCFFAPPTPRGGVGNLAAASWHENGLV